MRETNCATGLHRIGVDLTGEKVTDQRFAPYNRRLDEKLVRLLREKARVYVGTHVDEIEGKHVAHRLFIPMSDVGRLITPRILVSV
jgi:hypothetical protein